MVWWKPQGIFWRPLHMEVGITTTSSSSTTSGVVLTRRLLHVSDFRRIQHQLKRSHIRCEEFQPVDLCPSNIAWALEIQTHRMIWVHENHYTSTNFMVVAPLTKYTWVSPAALPGQFDVLLFPRPLPLLDYICFTFKDRWSENIQLRIMNLSELGCSRSFKNSFWITTSLPGAIDTCFQNTNKHIL